MIGQIHTPCRGSSQFGVGLGDFGGSGKDIFGDSGIGRSRAPGGGNVFQGGGFGSAAPSGQFGDSGDFQRGNIEVMLCFLQRTGSCIISTKS